MARLLVVDDDDLILRLFSDIFLFLGHDVTALSDGEAAMAYIESTSELDLLVTDIVMPHMSGDDLVNTILHRDDLANFPILIVSGEFWVGDLQKLLEYDRVNFVQKPAGVSELQAAVNLSLKKAGAAKQKYSTN